MESIDELMGRLPRIRDLLGWNQVQLAQLVGVTQPTISDWETGAAYPSRRNERILRQVIADALAGKRTAA